MCAHRNITDTITETYGLNPFDEAAYILDADFDQSEAELLDHTLCPYSMGAMSVMSSDELCHANRHRKSVSRKTRENRPVYDLVAILSMRPEQLHQLP